MKNVKTTKLMAVLATLCLVTSSFVGSTLAKYITTANAKDAARVAKFGVVLQADGNLYGEDYVDMIVVNETSAAKLAVQSDATIEAVADVVAPGTNNASGMNFSLNGKPEVATRLEATIEAENIYLAEGDYAVMVEAPTVTADSFPEGVYYTKADGKYTLAADFEFVDANDDKANDIIYYTMTDEATVAAGGYYPVVYKSTDLTSGTVGADSLNAIAADYAEKLNGAAVTGSVAAGKTTYTIKKDYNPNFDYASLGVEKESLTWEWVYFTDAETDARDTILGNLIAQKAEKDLEPGAKTFKGEVITLDTMKAPIEANGTDAGDYNLDTNFKIDFTVTQLDKEVGNAANN